MNDDLKSTVVLLVIVVILGSTGGLSEAQCVPRSDVYYGETVPNGTCGAYNTYSGLIVGRYFRIPVLSGALYDLSTCIVTDIDTQITGFQGTDVNTAVFYNDDNGPDCSGVRASVRFVPNYTDYSRVMINEYNCQPYAPSNPVISFQLRQIDNLAFTSSAAPMCAGESRLLVVTPGPITVTPEPGSGDPGTFSGSGVSGTTFTAPTPTGAFEDLTIQYDFGFCSATQTIRVYPDLVADAGPDQVVCSETGDPLAANAPPAGATGGWTGPPGVTFSPEASDPNAVPSGLSVGSNELTWTVSNEGCDRSDSMVVERADDFAVSAGNDQHVCGETSDPLGGSAPPSGGSGVWSGPPGVTFVPADDDPDASATGLEIGESIVSWEVTNGFCTAAEDVVIERKAFEATVTEPSASGEGSLREALSWVCEPGTIGFTPSLAGAVIDVGSAGEITIDRVITIDASPLAERPVLSGGGSSRIASVGPEGDLTLSAVGLTAGAAVEGGAIHNLGRLRLLGSVVADNAATASGGRGGAIYTGPGTVLEIEGSTIASNSTDYVGDGGAIFADADSTVVISNSTLFDNSTGLSGIGGAISAEDASLRITDTTISGNRADLTGGGLSVFGGSALTVVANTVLAGNVAPVGGPDVMGVLNGTAFNLVGDGTGSSGWGPTDVVGTAAAPIDPVLGPLSASGSATPVLRPRFGSPVIDAGSCRNGAVLIDQRGVARPYDDPLVGNADDGCDIGSVEALSPLFSDDFESGDLSRWSSTGS